MTHYRDRLNAGWFAPDYEPTPVPPAHRKDNAAADEQPSEAKTKRSSSRSRSASRSSPRK